jgi:hypothetical protein
MRAFLRFFSSIADAIMVTTELADILKKYQKDRELQAAYTLHRVEPSFDPHSIINKKKEKIVVKKGR